MSNTTPTVAEQVEKTQSLTQVAKSVSLYDQDLRLGLIMRPVKRVVDTKKISELFGSAKSSVQPAPQQKRDNTEGSQSESPPSAVSPTSALRTEQAVSEVANLLRASLISEDAIRGIEKRTQEEYGPLISMPLPEKIKDSLRVSYSSADLGMAAVGAVFGQDVANPNSDGASIANSLVGSSSYVVRTLLAALPGGIGALSQKLSGNIPNPFSAAIFEKVTPRKFSFNWTIQPQTPEESANLKDIINHLRYWSLPNPSQQRLILDVPYEWELSFVGTSFLYSFSRCVMSNLDIDYSPNGFNAFMADGAPQAVTILVEFEEIFPLDKSTIDEAGQGATSMRPSGVLETRADDRTPSEEEKRAAEQAAIQNVTTSRANYQTSILERNKREELYLKSKSEYDTFQSELSERPDLYAANKILYDRKLALLTENLNITTRFYNDALQNEQKSYNDYDVAWEEFKSDTQKESSVKAKPPEPSKISG